MSDDKNNSGVGNSGYYNSGNYNSGYRNSGNYNSGDYNSGYRNSGNRNSGDYNSGDYNSGYRNSGNRNSGDYNSGDYNSGDYNSGDYNSGDYNSGYYNSGFFNTDEPTVRLFNKDTGKKRKDITIPFIALKVTEWISDSMMTSDEKTANPEFHVAGGYLKKRTYKEAWAAAWVDATATVRMQFVNLPNFHADIFFEITGVDLREKVEPSCAGKTVEIDGKKYKLVEV
jgi:hypothetical protein